MIACRSLLNPIFFECNKNPNFYGDTYTLNRGSAAQPTNYTEQSQPMKQILLFTGLFVLIQTVKPQTSYTWNGSISTAWTTPGNWTPNGIPGSIDNVTIVMGSNTCILSTSASISNITLTSGTLDLGAGTLTVNGTTAAFSAGTVQNGTVTVTGATTTTFGNGPVTMNCNVNITSAAVTVKNTTFQATTNITKTGASNDGSGGNNIFNGAFTATNAGSGYLLFGNGNPDNFNAAATFNNTGSSNLYVAYNSTNNVFGGVTTFNNAPTAGTVIYVSQNSAGTIFNGNIVVNSTSGQGVQFCGNASSTATLSAGSTISVGAGGFSAGTLTLRQFTQTGATAQTLTLTGAGGLAFGPSSSFGGNVTATSPTLYLNGCTFNGTTNLTKTGTTGDFSSGGDVFNGLCSITNSGSSYLVLGNSSPDIWNSDVTFTDNGSERLLPCWGSTGNQFNGNIYVNTSGSATGIEFCGGNNTATALLAATKTIQAGTGGLTSGYLYLKQFTQSGSAPINLTATGTSALYLGPSSNFGGTFTATAPDIWAQGATYNSPAIFNKTGGSSNHNNQNQNIFNSTCTINQQSNTGYFMLGYGSNDLFNDNITVTSTGTGGIYLGWGSGTGTPTLAAGKTIFVGSAGFSAGFLALNTFTQLGSAPMNLTFTGTNTYILFARGSVIGGNVTTNTPDVYFSGGTFNGTVNVTKTGTGSDAGSGGDIFQDSATLTNTGTGYLILGNGTADTWNNAVSFNSSGTSYIGVGWNSAGNMFNGNMSVSSTGSSTGIIFCPNAASTATLAAGYSILNGTGGFFSGTLQLRQFTQLGSAAINLSLTGVTTLIQVGPSSAIGGNFTVVSPRILLNGAVYSDSVNVTKTGATGEWSFGGNTFNSTLTVNQQGSGYFGFANGAADTCNGDLYANNNSTERIIFGNNPVGNIYNGNIILTQTGSSVGTAFGWSATTNETMAAGKTISIGAAGFSTGYLQIERFTQLGNTAVNLPLTGNASLTFGPTSSFGGNVTASSPSMFLNGCVFNGTVNLTKTGTTGDYSQGGNTFNGLCSITNSGSSYFLLGNVNPDIWNTDVTFTDNGSERLLPCWGSVGNQFNGNIYVNTSGSAAGIEFCGGNTTATATQAAGMTVMAGSGGLNAGYLILKQFTQLGGVAVNLTMNSPATYLQFGPGSAIGGSVTSSSPGLDFNGCTFGGTVTCTKTGSTSDAGIGNNIFNGVATLTNAGSGYLMFGNGNADQFNTTATFNNTGSSNIYVAYNSSNNVFGGVTTFNNSPTANTQIYVSPYSVGTTFANNIVVSSTSGQGILFCTGNATATATLAAGNTISVGPGGFSAGTLLFRQFTQVGATAQSLTLTGTGNLTFGPISSFGGNITTSSPTLLLNGCTFNGVSSFTKTGTTGDFSTGGNVFNGLCSITNSATDYLVLGNVSPDIWNTDVTFTDNGSERLLPCWGSAGNQFNGNIYVNTSGSAQGIQFCGGNTTATATLAAGMTIQPGTGGLNAGYLILKQFIQLGNAPINLTLNNTATYLQYGPGSTLDGNVTSQSPGVLFNGCTFNGTATCTKIGASNDGSSGNNVFNGVATMTNAGSGYLMFGNGNADQFNTTATFNNTGGSNIYAAYNSSNNVFGGVTTFNNTPTANTAIYVSSYSPGTAFNNNIVVSSTSGQGVQFCTGNINATASLAGGYTISVGGGGFAAGTLMLRQFTQMSATAQNLTLTGTGNLTFGPSSAFAGNVTTLSPVLFFNGCTFSGVVNCTKNGISNDQSTGNNVFNGSSTFTDAGTGYLALAGFQPDAYNGDVTFVQSSTGAMYPNYNANCTYAGNVTVTSPAATAITFGASANGTATFSGAAVQTINATAGATPVFSRLVIANTGGGVTLNNTNISVSKNLTLTSGLLNTTTTYMLTMLNGSVTAPGTALSTSYVNGPMRYQKSNSGTSTLNFPIGTSPDCRPIVLTVNHTSNSLYTYQAQLFDQSARLLGYTPPPSIDQVSDVHYYTIGRTNAAGANQPTLDLGGNQTIQIFFGSNDYVSNGATLTIVKNTYTAPTAWINIGGASGPPYNAGANLSGSITSTSSPTPFNSFSTFALADQIGGGNVLPVELLYFNAVADNSRVDLTWATSTESNNSYFTIEKSKDGVNFESAGTVGTKALNGNSSVQLNYVAYDPNPYAGLSYYRLKQTDLDGNSTYSATASVNFNKKQNIAIYPNPSTGTVYISGVDVNQSSLSVEWYDISGRLLVQETVSVQNGVARLDTHFRNGVYMLKFISADGTVSVHNVIIMK